MGAQPLFYQDAGGRKWHIRVFPFADLDLFSLVLHLGLSLLG
jgi:hypothetical protein